MVRIKENSISLWTEIARWVGRVEGSHIRIGNMDETKRPSRESGLSGRTWAVLWHYFRKGGVKARGETWREITSFGKNQLKEVFSSSLRGPVEGGIGKRRPITLLTARGSLKKPG